MVDIEKLRARLKLCASPNMLRRQGNNVTAEIIASVSALLDELERKTKALEAVREICRNDGRGSAIVNERIVERCEEVAIAALKGTPNDH